jgi:hypothetical protein
VTTIRLSIGATVTTRPERNAFKALKLAAPFMRWKHSPHTTDEAQAVAYAVLALILAPYVDGLDAPALGDARDGGAGPMAVEGTAIAGPTIVRSSIRRRITTQPRPAIGWAI